MQYQTQRRFFTNTRQTRKLVYGIFYKLRGIFHDLIKLQYSSFASSGIHKAVGSLLTKNWIKFWACPLTTLPLVGLDQQASAAFGVGLSSTPHSLRSLSCFGKANLSSTKVLKISYLNKSDCFPWSAQISSFAKRKEILLACGRLVSS